MSNTKLNDTIFFLLARQQVFPSLPMSEILLFKQKTKTVTSCLSPDQTYHQEEHVLKCLESEMMCF